MPNISRIRAFALALLSLYVSSYSYGQAIGDFRSTTSGNWNAISTWQQCLSTGVWAAAITTPTSANGIITIQSGHTVTVSANVTVDQLTISGTMDVSAGQTVTVANGAGNDVTVSGGTITNSGTISINASALVSSGTLTNNTPGNIIVNGILNTAASTVASNSGAITINAGGAMSNSAAFTNTSTGILTNSQTLTNAAGSIINNGIFNNNLTFNNNSASVFTNNLTLNNATAGVITQSSSAVFTNGSAGTFTNYGTLTLTAPRTITCNGILVNSGTVNSGPVTYGTLTFSATGIYRHNFSSAAAAVGTIPAATWSAGSLCEIQACGNSGNGPNGLNQTFSDFTWNNSTQAVDVNLNATLGSSRDLTIINTNTKKLILRHTSSGSNTIVSRDLNILPNAILIFTDGDASFGSSGHTVSIGRNYNQTGGSCTFTTSAGTGSTAGTGSGTMNLTGNLNLSAGTLCLNATAAVSSICYAYCNVTGSCLISGGTLNLSSGTTTGGGGAGTLNVSGDFTHTAGTVTQTGSTVATININGTGTQNIESTGFSGTIAFTIGQTTATGICAVPASKTFVLNAGTTFTLNNNTSTNPDLNITGTLISNTSAWLYTGQASLTGTFINNSTGLIQANSTSSTLACAAGSVFRMAGNGGQVATASWNATSTLEVTGLTSADSIGNCNQLFGKIYWACSAQSSSATFKGVFTTPVFGTQSDFSVFDTGPLAGTGKLRFPDLNFTIGNDLYVNYDAKVQVANGTGLYSPAYRVITINNDLILASFATISVGTPNSTASAAFAANKARTYVFSIKGDFLYAGGHLISYDHKSYNGANNDEEYRLVLNFSGGISQTISMGDTGTYSMTYTSGNGIANDATADEFVSGDYPYRITVTGSNTKLKCNNFIAYNSMQVGTSAVADTLDFASLGTLSGAIHIAMLDSLGNKKYASTTIGGSAVLDMGTVAITQAPAGDSSTFFLNSLAEIKTQHADGISGTAATGCLQVTGSRILNPNANYTYNGTAAQSTGNALPATLTGVLEIDNSFALTSGGVTLTQATSITGASGTRKLSLLDGRLITTAATLLNLGNGTTVTPTGGSAISFVDGPVKKTGNAAFIFPTGDVQGAIAKWARVAIAAPGTVTDAYTAQYNFINPHIVSTVYGAGVSDISYREYWALTRVAGATAPLVTLYWEDGSTGSDGSGISSIATADLRVAEFHSAAWNDKSSGSTSGSAAQGTITTASTFFTTGTAFPFTLQSPTGSNPLPVELLSFEGHATGNGNLLTWSTATETNNDYFELEHGLDANTFTTVAAIDGNGNSTSVINYEKTDEQPANAVNYYRLKQVDFNGDYKYSPVVAIDNTHAANDPFVSAYPNPANGDLVNISVSDNINMLAVYNILGEKVYQIEYLSQGSKIIQLNIFAKGVYVIKAVTGDNKMVTSKFTRN